MIQTNETRIEEVNDAAMFAISCHSQRNQMYGDQPYSFHLSQTVSILYEFNLSSPHLLSAAWLHDVIEDTETTTEDLLYFGFSEEVVDIVVGCTGIGENRKKKQELIFKAMMSCYHTSIVKSADRLANIKHSFFTQNEAKLKMYRKEHEHFYVMSQKHRQLIPMTEQMAGYLFFRAVR
jgi:(p)ppGpp synthase/HD superfamily hydrolase